MHDIWQEAQGEQFIRPILAKVYRLVESQEQIATLSLVDNVYEQGLLEELIEQTKRPLGLEYDGLHYLLKTPFRYPPLRHGSRFGQRFEQGMFYSALNIKTALAETAYYRFVYLQGMEIPYQQAITSEFSSFSVNIKSERGVLLDEPPFAAFQAVLCSRNSYADTQQLGAAMRRAGVEAFRYTSARDKQGGKNLAAFSPGAFASKKPGQLRQWLCQTSPKEVGFVAREGDERYLFSLSDFLDGQFLPVPAV